MPRALDSSESVKKIDAGLKNQFKFDWLESVISVPDSEGNGEICKKIKDHKIIKIAEKGKAYCQICQYTINYSSGGKSVITAHMKKKKHLTKFHEAEKHSAQIAQVSVDDDVTTLTLERKNSVTLSVPDRVIGLQAMVLGFLAEKSLPLSVSPDLIDLAQTLAADKRALDKLTMDRTSASYKMTFGMAKTLTDATVKSIKENGFSLNIDESTSSGHKHVLSILVSYFNDDQTCVLVEHLSSVELSQLNTDSIFTQIDAIFKQHGIPWEKLVSTLMDSCSVMRGSKAGLETRIRTERAPDLLDVDGDIVHHIHNACKRFCQPFGNWVEKLFADIHADVSRCSERESLSELCELIGVSFTMPTQFVPHRWLSAYDSALSVLRLWDAYILFYMSFLSVGPRTMYASKKCEILRKHGTSSEARGRIIEIQNMLSKKKHTDDGRERKDRIIEKIFKQSDKSRLILNFYVSVLPMLKSYVCLFQSATPIIHLVHDRISTLLIEFLTCFVKPELLYQKKVREIQALQLSNSELLPSTDIFIGNENKTALSALGKTSDCYVEFVRNVIVSYKSCAAYMIKKLPLANLNLKAFSSLDPNARAHSRFLRLMQTLSESSVAKLTSQEKDAYDRQVRNYMVDDQLPLVDDNMALDTWWNLVFSSGRYNTLARVVKPVLSIFHGPAIESSFNIMGDIMDTRSSRMNVETYSSFQTVKYALRSRKTKATKFFALGSENPFSKTLITNMKLSSRMYRLRLEKRRQLKEERRARLKILKSAETRAANKRKTDEISKKALMAFQNRQESRQKRIAALEKLAAKRRKMSQKR